MGKPTAYRNVHSSAALAAYPRAIRTLSDRLVEAQRPIRILDASKWDDDIERAFFARQGRELPPVTHDYYTSRPLPFDPSRKYAELQCIEEDIHRQLGTCDPPGRIMTRMCREYREVVQLLQERGTPAFAAASRHLYGSACDHVENGQSLADFARQRAAALATAAAENGEAAQRWEAREAVQVLAQRLTDYFPDEAGVRIRLSDGIVADAAAGCDYIKLRGDALFSLQDLQVLEVHEGWVHLGTTLNGQQQPVCTFLSKGPPSSTITQEGLAVLTEMLAQVAHPARLRRLFHRIEAVGLAEEGADFRDVYRFFLEHDYEPRECYQHTMRVFRGSLPAGCGPFTKDICYGKGLLLASAFIQQAIEQADLDQLPLLFCGKTALGDMPALAELAEQGLVTPPRYLPPPFADPHRLAQDVREMSSR